VVFAVPRGAVVRAVQFAAQGRVAWTLRWQA
jgi:hypothetical protein